MHIAQRIGRLGTETAFEVLAKARKLEAQGRDIVHLEIGEPDFDTPTNIVDAAKRALDEGFTHYGPSAGLPQARESIARYVERTRPGVAVTADEVVVTPGAKPIMFYAMLATIDEGDEVIYPNPGFPIYESVIESAFAEIASSTERVALTITDPYAAVGAFVDLITDYFVHNHEVQAIVSRESADGGRRMKAVVERSLKVPFTLAAGFYEEAARKGLVAPFDGRHWVVNVFGMIAWYFHNLKVVEMLWPEDLEAPSVVARRKAEMTRLILDGIRPRN